MSEIQDLVKFTKNDFARAWECLDPRWKALIKRSGVQLTAAIEYAIKCGAVRPDPNLLFRAFNLCPMYTEYNGELYRNVKVVIIGQDPYPNKDADGLAFSVNPKSKIPGSLKNIFMCLNQNLGYAYPQTGELEHWARQGVLLLNTALLYCGRDKQIENLKYWREFTASLIANISDTFAGVVFMLFGNLAKQFEKNIDPKKHHILTWSHPSPTSTINNDLLNPAHFVHCDAFAKCNEILGDYAIIWGATEYARELDTMTHGMNEYMQEAANITRDDVPTRDGTNGGTNNTINDANITTDDRKQPPESNIENRLVESTNKYIMIDPRASINITLTEPPRKTEIAFEDLPKINEQTQNTTAYTFGPLPEQTPDPGQIQSQDRDHDRDHDQDHDQDPAPEQLYINPTDFIKEEKHNFNSAILITDGAASKNGQTLCRASWAFAAIKLTTDPNKDLLKHMSKIDVDNIAQFNRGDFTFKNPETVEFVYDYSEISAAKYNGEVLLPSNNRAELSGIINGLKHLLASGITRGLVISDSEYCINVITTHLKKWKIAKKVHEMKNPDLILELDDLCSKFTNLLWIHVRSHKDPPKLPNTPTTIDHYLMFAWYFNDIVDKLAVEGLKQNK